MHASMVDDRRLSSRRDGCTFDRPAVMNPFRHRPLRTGRGHFSGFSSTALHGALQNRATLCSIDPVRSLHTRSFAPLTVEHITATRSALLSATSTDSSTEYASSSVPRHCWFEPFTSAHRHDEIAEKRLDGTRANHVEHHQLDLLTLYSSGGCPFYGTVCATAITHNDTRSQTDKHNLDLHSHNASTTPRIRQGFSPRPGQQHPYDPVRFRPASIAVVDAAGGASDGCDGAVE